MKSKYLYMVCISLLFGFIISICIDYFTYDNTSYSAPFYACILVKSAEFLLPCFITWIIAKIIKKKESKK